MLIYKSPPLTCYFCCLSLLIDAVLLICNRYIIIDVFIIIIGFDVKSINRIIIIIGFDVKSINRIIIIIGFDVKSINRIIIIIVFDVKVYINIDK